MPQPPQGGGIKRWCASDVWRLRLSVAYISREQRPRKTKISTEVAHVTRDSDTTFQGQKVKCQLAGGWGLLNLQLRLGGGIAIFRMVGYVLSGVCLLFCDMSRLSGVYALYWVSFSLYVYLQHWSSLIAKGEVILSHCSCFISCSSSLWLKI